MPKEKSAGAIIFRLEDKKAQYLLLHYPSSERAKSEYWDLPKGHVEEGETEEETAIREVREETGLEAVRIFEGFRETIHYWFRAEGKTISKTVVFYLAQTDEKDIKISDEHLGYQWLPYEKALDRLTHENAKLLLKKANTFLTERNIL